MHPIVTGLLASAISPPENGLIQPRSVIDQLPMRIIEQCADHAGVFFTRSSREHCFEGLAHVRHRRTTPNEIPSAIDHHPLCIWRYSQRVVRNELEPPAVTLAHRGINPGVEVAID